jgi:hypothetical protein
MTALDYVTRALRTIGFVGEDQTPTPSQANDALLIFQDLIDAWNADRRVVFLDNRTVFPLSTGIATYTIGNGATFNHDRPGWIAHAAVIRTTDPLAFEYPVDVLDEESYEAIVIKGLLSTIVTGLRMDDSVPFANISVYPVPSDATQQLVLYIPGLLQGAPILTTPIVIQPGGARMVRTNLAVELHPEFGRGKPLNPVLAKQAEVSKRDWIDMRDVGSILTPDPGIVAAAGAGRFNIYTNRNKTR